MFSRIETNLNTQLRRLEDMDIVNYFIMSKIDRINQVLMAASQENYFGKKYSWTAITKAITNLNVCFHPDFIKLQLLNLLYRNQLGNRLSGVTMLQFCLPTQLSILKYQVGFSTKLLVLTSTTV